VTGGATVAAGAVLGGGGGTGLGDGRFGDGGFELGGGGAGTAEVLEGAGAGGWLVVLVSVNATPPMATIETSAAIPKNSCGKRFPRYDSSGSSTFGNWSN
jgi:hypothetical protein